MLKLTDHAIKILEKRYLLKDIDGKVVETVDEMFRRVARAISSVESKSTQYWEDQFYDLMTRMDFLPNSPTLMNAGKSDGQLSACFVLPVADTMNDIFTAVKNAALIHKSGGGTGFSFSRLRPKGSAVNSTGGVSSGPVSFMKVFNAATEAVKQGGARRGANMGTLRVDHPDILEFITCKSDNADITNFNISVSITNIFMEAVINGTDYSLIDPNTKKTVERLDARKVFDLIVEMAYKNGEPGILFIDRINECNIVPEVEAIESTNPCGEVPLLPYEACNLGSINLSNMASRTAQAVDWSKLKYTIELAVRFLDNVVEANTFPLPEIEYKAKLYRKIGLGVMGWADLLCKLGVGYNTDEARDLARKIGIFILDTAKEASKKLGAERGSFPGIEDSIYAGEILRNGTFTTVAPTGTLSIIANCSGGIEPLFALVVVRNQADMVAVDVNTLFAQEAKSYGIEHLMQEIATQGSLAYIKDIPEKLRRVYVTSHDIDYMDHIKMQDAWQSSTSNAVSKTINLKSTATKDDVRKAYLYAYQYTCCKGLTVYRDGSRDGQVLNVGRVSGSTTSVAETPPEARTRPQTVRGVTSKMKIGCGNLYVTVNYDDQGICEIFTHNGKGGGCASQSQAASRLASVALRSGMSPKDIIEQLKGIRCPSATRQKGLDALSCPDAIGRVLEKVLLEQSSLKLQSTPTKKEETASSHSVASICPECKKPVTHEGGCVVCKDCGYSKCG